MVALLVALQYNKSLQPMTLRAKLMTTMAFGSVTIVLQSFLLGFQPHESKDNGPEEAFDAQGARGYHFAWTLQVESQRKP
ncbi:hypothetical protein V6N13_116616 [Hibiscus sabdariffa]